MASLAHTVRRNVSYSVAAQIIIKAVSFVFSVLVIRRLGVEAYGQYAAVLAFGAMFTFLADLGLSPYLVREVARVRDQPEGQQRAAELFGNVLSLRLLLGAAAASLLVGAAWLTGRPPLMIGAIALNAIGLVIYCVQGTADAVLTGYERLDRSAAAKVVYQLAFVALGTGALAVGLGYYGLIGATLTAIGLMTVLCWLGVRQLGLRPAAPRPHMWLTLLQASLPFGVIGLTLGLSYKFDSVLLNLFYGDAETGYYNAAYNLVFSVVMISNVLNVSLFPSLTREAARRPHSLGGVYEHLLRYLLLISLPIAVGGSALADQIVAFLFTASYSPAAPVLRIVVWVVPLMFTSESLGYIITIRGQERKIARALILSTMINVLANLAVVPFFGLWGAATMTVLTEVILVAQYLWLLRALIRDFNVLRTVLYPGAAAALMGVASLLLQSVNTPLLLNVVLSASVYLALVLAMGLLSPAELRFLRSLPG